MNETQIVTLLDKTIHAFKGAKRAFLEAAALLHEVDIKNAWEGRYSSFGEFVEDGAQISKGMASKLLKVYRHFVLEGSFAAKQLELVDPEKLYLAINLEGNYQKQYEQAIALSRQELRQSKGDDAPCTEHVPYCAKCHIKL